MRQRLFDELLLSVQDEAVEQFSVQLRLNVHDEQEEEEKPQPPYALQYEAV
jgi:hypothetical protein